MPDRVSPVMQIKSLLQQTQVVLLVQEQASLQVAKSAIYRKILIAVGESR